MRKRSLVAVLGLAALLVAGCGDDDDTATVDADAESSTESVETSSSAPADADDDEDEDTDAQADEDADASACPSETLLTATTETTYEGDVEVLAPDTPFPVGHFTLDLDGSGFGPILDGVFSTDASEDVASMTHTGLDAPPEGVRRVEVLLEGPGEGATEFPLGIYDVTFADGKVDATEGMGLSQLDVVEGGTGYQARNFTELEITHIGDDVICGEFRSVDHSEDTSQAPTWIEGEFVADYSEQP